MRAPMAFTRWWKNLGRVRTQDEVARTTHRPLDRDGTDFVSGSCKVPCFICCCCRQTVNGFLRPIPTVWSALDEMAEVTAR